MYFCLKYLNSDTFQSKPHKNVDFVPKKGLKFLLTEIQCIYDFLNPLKIIFTSSMFFFTNSFTPPDKFTTQFP